MKNIYCFFVFMLFGTRLAAQTTLPPEMVFVEGGTFTMGCTGEQQPCFSTWESPTRLVRVMSFGIGKFEVTQAQYLTIMGLNPSEYPNCGSSCPVDNVSLYDCFTFCNRLSLTHNFLPCYYMDENFTIVFDSMVGSSNQPFPIVSVYWNPDADGYRIPTEAEWEYAARGANMPHEKRYMGSDDINVVGWNEDNANYVPHSVGLLLDCYPGTFDMSGNVSEWTYDFLSLFGNLNLINGQCQKPYQVIWRGGDVQTNNRNNVSWRYSFASPTQGYRDQNIGFRLARNAD